MASAEFDDTIGEKRPTVQVGDPFTEKCLLEACLELMASGAVIAIQDMGAAGLTCSAVEMGAKGDLGIELDLDRVPVRETNMSAYEMMLSESQERMLMILKPELEKEASAIFKKWGLDFAIVGKTTDDLRFRVLQHGKEVANLPIKELGDEAPEYDRPWVKPHEASPVSLAQIKQVDLQEALLKLVGSADQSSRRWVYEQYDTLIQGNSLVRPGADAGVIRVEGNPRKALAFTSDVTPRYCQADPFEGGKQAVAECWRNLCATGAKPLACSDNLNFGNPEKPEIMGQLVYAIKGIGEACKALQFPIVSGNVSLYNETNGEGILPTPTMAGVGLIADWHKMARIDGMKDDDIILLVGRCGSHLGQSIYLRDILGKAEGTPPPVDLAEEKKNGNFVWKLIENNEVAACHDLSDGGLAIALAEMVIKSGRGVKIKLTGKTPAHAELFGEDQARYLIAVNSEKLDQLKQQAKDSGVELTELGTVVGDKLVVQEHIELSAKDLENAYESWFPDFMENK